MILVNKNVIYKEFGIRVLIFLWVSRRNRELRLSAYEFCELMWFLEIFGLVVMLSRVFGYGFLWFWICLVKKFDMIVVVVMPMTQGVRFGLL